MNVFIMQDSLIKPFGGDAQNALIGFVGENNSRTFFIRTRDDLTGYTVSLVIDETDCGTMTKTPMPDGSTMLTLTLTSGMLGQGGNKICQLIMANDTTVKKSSQFFAFVGLANDITQAATDSATLIVISEAITQMISDSIPADYSALSTQVSQLSADLEDLDERVEALESGGGGSGLTDAVKNALLACFDNVAWKDTNGQTYYDDLYYALYAITAITLNTGSISMQTIGATSQLTATTTPAGGNVTWSSSNTSVATVSSTGLVTSVAYGSATITATAGSVSTTCDVVVAQATCTGITASYTQSGTVYDNASLDDLKADLVVTASWSNGTTSTLNDADYTLSGTLAEGTSTITVSYGGKTTTFNVTVTDASIMSIAQGNITNSLSETDRVTVIFNQTTFNPSNVMTFTAVDGYQVYVLDMNANPQDKAGTVQSTNKLNVYAVTSTGVVYSGATVKSRLSFTLGWDTAKTITCTATDLSINCTGYGIMVKSTDGSALTPQQARSVFTKTMG